jgi:hypothetical protein
MTPEEREKMMSIPQTPPDNAFPDRLTEVMQYTNLSRAHAMSGRGKWSTTLIRQLFYNKKK